MDAPLFIELVASHRLNQVISKRHALSIRAPRPFFRPTILNEFPKSRKMCIIAGGAQVSNKQNEAIMSEQAQTTWRSKRRFRFRGTRIDTGSNPRRRS
jgi:hypothetical protein